MTLHWWMHWFWVTLIHSVVSFPLILPGTYSAPSQGKLHGFQSPVSPPLPVPGRDASWDIKEAPPVEGVGPHDSGTATEKVAAQNVHGVPSIPRVDHEGLAYVSTESSVIRKEKAPSAKVVVDEDKESTSESNKEPPLFLEEENERGWGLDDPAPRPPILLQSADLGDLYEEEDEDEGIRAAVGVPWFHSAAPQVEVRSGSESPTIIPANETPSSTVEPWPANISPDRSGAGESQPDVSEGGESAGREPREQPQEPNPEPSINSSPLPEAIVSSETLTSPSSLRTLYISSSASPSPPFSYSSTPSYSDSSSPESTYEDSSSTPTSSYADSSSSTSPSDTDSSFPSTSQFTPTTISDVSPTLSSLLIPSDALSSDAVHVREGKAIGVSHIDQQPKQEQKQVEVKIGSNVTVSATARPTKFDVESSPVKSSSDVNATSVVGEEDDIKKENITKDSSGPLILDSSSSNSDGNVKKVEDSGKTRFPPVILEDKAKKGDEKGVVDTEAEKVPESTNINGSVVDKSGSNLGKPVQEEEITSPVEVPTAVPVREGGPSIQNSPPEEKERDGKGKPSEKVDKESETAADVPSSVHQGRMTAPRSLDAASIVGISLGSVLLVGAVAGGIGFVLYRRSLYANKPQTLNDKCSNPDSSGYIDDTLRVSSACTSTHGPKLAPRSRVELTRNGGQGRQGGGRGGGGEGGKERRPSGAKENSEEMYSLDNDSFLNSLEAMTIQNYWTDSVKHTKL